MIKHEEIAFPNKKGPALASGIGPENSIYAGEITFADTQETNDIENSLYLYPIVDPSTQDIIKAAKFLKIDPVQYLNVIMGFLRNPLQKPWTFMEQNGAIRYKNLETGDIIDRHPGVDSFTELYNKLKAKKQNTLTKVKALMMPKINSFLFEKYTNGLKVFFKHEKSAFESKRAKTDQWIDDYMRKVKQTHGLIMKIEEEREKKIASGSLYLKANDTINAELLSLMNAYKFSKVI